MWGNNSFYFKLCEPTGTTAFETESPETEQTAEPLEKKSL